MSRFDDRLEQGLGRIAEGATPSPDAWQAIQQRVADQANQPEMEVIMLQKKEPDPRRVRAWLVGSAAAVVLVIVGIVVLNDSDDEGNVVTGDPTSTPVPTETAEAQPTAEPEPTQSEDPEPTAEPVAEPTAQPAPEAPVVWVGEGSEWDFSVTYIDVSAAGPVGSNEDFAWVASQAETALATIDLATDRVVAETPIPAGARVTQFGFGSVWITHNDGTVSRFDPDSGTVVATIEVGAGALSWMQPGSSFVWVGDRLGRRVVAIDPATNEVAIATGIGAEPGAVKEEAHGVWVKGLDGSVYRLDPVTGDLVASVDTGSFANGAMMTSPEAVWAPFGSELIRVDPETNSVAATIDMSAAIGVDVRLGGIHFADRTIWVRYHHDNGTGIARVDPATNRVVAARDLRDGWASTGGMNVGPTTTWTFNPDAIARIDF
ncbi:MAG: hypothetical protein AAF480_19135 [Actinomycetota bacterium]